MTNMKPIIVRALKSIPDVKQVCSEYPDEFHRMPTITYKENENSDSGLTIDEIVSVLEYQIDIWKKGSTYDLERQVNEKLSGMGFRRIMSNELTDPGTGLKHRIMRFRGRYCALDGCIYQ